MIQLIDFSTLALPDVPTFVVRIPEVYRGPRARQQIRQALGLLVTRWLGPEVQVFETSVGPTLSDSTWLISLSYDGTDGWIAWSASGAVGVDAVLVEPLVEMPELVRDYLQGVGFPLNAATNTQAFAMSWSAMEAVLKRDRRALQPRQYWDVRGVKHLRYGAVVVALAS